jgi:ABC-type uncharacterized transport system substrate-binding protein
VPTLLLTGVIAGQPAVGADPPPNIAVVFGAKGPYRVAAESLAKELGSRGAACALVELPEDGNSPAYQQALERVVNLKPALVASGGAAATAELAKLLPDTPVVFFMLPNALDAPFLQPDVPRRERIAGIASDIAPADQIDWIKRTAPTTKTVAVLGSARTQRTIAALEKAGRERGIAVLPVTATRAEFPAALEALNRSNCDGVLMIPDAQVYSPPNVEALLLWGLRGKKPIWTFSENVVAAGALAGLYCDAGTVGKQAAELIQQKLGGADPAKLGVQYPRGLGEAVRGAVNAHTAEMIGCALDERIFVQGILRAGGQ